MRYFHHSWSTSYFPAQHIPSSYSLCPCIRISHFSRKLWFLLVKNSFLETSIWAYVCSLQVGHHCCQAFLMERARKYIPSCIYKHTHIHHIFISSFSTYICLIMLKTMNSHRYLQFQSNRNRLILVFFLSVFVTLFSDIKKSVVFNIFIRPILLYVISLLLLLPHHHYHHHYHHYHTTAKHYPHLAEAVYLQWVSAVLFPVGLPCDLAQPLTTGAQLPLLPVSPILHDSLPCFVPPKVCTLKYSES